MSSAIEYLHQAEQEKIALGHFNVANLETFWGVVQAARERQTPFFVGVSEGERDFIGVSQIKALVDSVRVNEGLPIFLNADHTYSFERVQEVIDAGFDSVIIDGAQLPFEENIELTARCVEYARENAPEVLVEAELGYIGSSSKLLDELPEGAAVTEDMITKPEEAEEFVRRTGVDLLAPAVGTIHGMMKKGLNPQLHIERIAELRQAARVPLVLHGGSGSSPEDMKSAVEAGMGMVHISTEIRLAYKEGLQQALESRPEEIAPYKYLDIPVKKVTETVTDKLQLLGC